MPQIKNLLEVSSQTHPAAWRLTSMADSSWCVTKLLFEVNSFDKNRLWCGTWISNEIQFDVNIWKADRYY